MESMVFGCTTQVATSPVLESARLWAAKGQGSNATTPGREQFRGLSLATGQQL